MQSDSAACPCLCHTLKWRAGGVAMPVRKSHYSRATVLIKTLLSCQLHYLVKYCTSLCNYQLRDFFLRDFFGRNVYAAFRMLSLLEGPGYNFLTEVLTKFLAFILVWASWASTACLAPS